MSSKHRLGIAREPSRRSCRQACCRRRRFTVLDLAVRAGQLDAALDRLFGPTGLWPIEPSRQPYATSRP